MHSHHISVHNTTAQTERPYKWLLAWYTCSLGCTSRSAMAPSDNVMFVKNPHAPSYKCMTEGMTIVKP